MGGGGGGGGGGGRALLTFNWEPKVKSDCIKRLLVSDLKCQGPIKSEL